MALKNATSATKLKKIKNKKSHELRFKSALTKNNKNTNPDLRTRIFSFILNYWIKINKEVNPDHKSTRRWTQIKSTHEHEPRCLGPRRYTHWPLTKRLSLSLSLSMYIVNPHLFFLISIPNICLLLRSFSFPRESRMPRILVVEDHSREKR